MKKTFFGLMAVLLLASMLVLTSNIFQVESSEPPTTEWTRTYGGTNEDVALSVVQTGDGGYAMAGWTRSFGAGGDDYWFVKTDWTGNVQLNHTFGGTQNDYAYSVVQTSDGGYAVAGFTNSFGEIGQVTPNFWLVKTDMAGNMEWNRTYGGTSGDKAYSVVQTSDGGYAVAGRTRSFGAGDEDFWLIKTNSSGHMQWSETYGGTGEDVAFSVVQTSDGGYAMAGETRSFGAGQSDFWLVKSYPNGTMQWSKTYGGTGKDVANSVVQTSDGGYAIAGDTLSFGGWDFWLVKTNSTGHEEWNKTYDIGFSHDIAWSLIQTGDGGYLFAGQTGSGPGADALLAKTDANGNMQWNQTYGGTNHDVTYSVVQTSDGGYAIAGETKSFGAGGHDFWLTKLASEKIPATIDIDPNTLNLKSKGEWITAYIELPEGYNVNDINVSTILLNDTIPVDPDAPTEIGDYDSDSVLDLMVKFDRTEVISHMEGKSATVTLTITGKLYDNTPFQGSDTIRILVPHPNGKGKVFDS